MQSDILVIGGGIAGVSVAARMSSLGKVALLEAETAVGYHASGRSAALFEVTYGHPAGVALNEAGQDYLMTAHGGVLSPRGLMIVARAEDDAAFEKDLVEMHMTEIDIDAARALIPILNPETVARAGHHDDAWDIDTDLLIQNFLRDMRGNGGVLHTGQRVTGITRDGGLWRVTTEAGGDFAAPTLVNAAGAWVDEIAKMAGVAPLGFTPLRRSMARLPAPGGHDVGTWPMVFACNDRWYARPDAGSLIVSPSEEDPQDPHDAWADDMVLAEGLARYEEMVTEPVTRLEANWAGLRTFAPDRALVIGPDPKHPGFFWHAGQGGSGFQTAPAASQLAADVLAGRTPEIGQAIADQLSPARFR